jgi:hypothetical protein
MQGNLTPSLARGRRAHEFGPRRAHRDDGKLNAGRTNLPDLPCRGCAVRHCREAPRHGFSILLFCAV